MHGLSGEYKGLHISTFFAHSYLHEEILLQGNTTSRKNSTSVPADNINRIIEMANGRKKSAEDKQAEIDALYAKIQAGNKELAVPFPQQEEFNKLSLRSTELIRLLNEDVDANEREKANMKVEKERRINSILNGEPNSLCEKSFFIFARKQLNNNEDWSETLDKNAISFLIDEGFPIDSISNTIRKCSPAVPSKEDVCSMLEDCSHRAASCR